MFTNAFSINVARACAHIYATRLTSAEEAPVLEPPQRIGGAGKYKTERERDKERSLALIGGPLSTGIARDSTESWISAARTSRSHL